MAAIRTCVIRAIAIGAAATFVLAACSGSDDATSDSSGATADGAAVSSTVATESRPVPTVPPTTAEGQVDTSTPGVIDASPTIVAVSSTAPPVSQAPPSTQLVGDPQPIPGTTQAPPPPTVVAPPAACVRLAAFDVVGVITDSSGVATTEETVSDTVCRYRSGSIVAEVHFVPRSTITGDWYTRSGIEPVGEVSGEAVGFGSFMPPGATTAAGYTIAMEGGDQGVIVGVRGTSDARYVAGQVAIFANQAA